MIDYIIQRYPRKSARILELTSPLTSLFLISTLLWGAFFIPYVLAYCIIFFDIYWLYKSINLAVCSFIAAKKIKETEKVNWNKKVQALPFYKTVHHVIVIPTYKEPLEKLRLTIDSIKNQTFSQKQMHIFIALEVREEEVHEKARVLAHEYRNVFGGFYSTFHPDVPDEVAGKSSNQAYAARVAYDLLIEKKGFNINYMTISSVDADSIFDTQLFACLTHQFLKNPDRNYRFWQSANVGYNNFWEVPAFTRVIAFFGSLMRASLLVQGLRLIPNSTYTLSFKLLREIGFWDTDVVPEDYRTFFKAFFATRGKVSVEPLYLKTSMDVAQSNGYLKSLLNKYHQERRWAWGVSDDAVYLKWYLTVKDVPFFKKTYLVANVLLDHILWPVNWFIITISANLILILNPLFSRSSIGYSLPQLSGFILTLCLFALLIMLYVDFDLRVRKYSKSSRLRQFVFPLEFTLMPVAGFFLSTLPALIAHLHLIVGKKLEYKVTEKV